MHAFVLLWRLVFGLVWLVLASMVWVSAGAAQADTLQLTLPEALARVAGHAPEALMAEAAVRQVQARRVGAGVVMPQNPRLAVDLRPPADRGFVREAGYSAMLDLLFEVGGAPAARVREVDAEVGVARAEQQLQLLAARVRVWAIYLEAQLAALRIAHAQAAAEIAQRVLEAARKRVEMGAASDLELASAQLELAQSEVAGKAAERERAQLGTALRQQLDLPARAELVLTTPIEDPPELTDVNGYLSRARQQHPLLLAAQARRAALSARRERLERERVPRVGFYTGIDAAPQSHVFALLGVSVELPFAQRNQGPLAVVARAQSAELVRAALDERHIEREVLGAFAAHELRRKELALLTNAALPAAQRSFELAEAGFGAGRFDLFRVALAARDLVRVRAERLAALSAAWAQRIALEHAAGGLLP